MNKHARFEFKSQSCLLSEFEITAFRDSPTRTKKAVEHPPLGKFHPSPRSILNHTGLAGASSLGLDYNRFGLLNHTENHIGIIETKMEAAIYKRGLHKV